MSEVVNNFRGLIVWQKSHELTMEIYKLTSFFPSDEKFGLVSQMRRAAYSIPANIVEGHSRKSKKEFLQFLNIAKGSLEELRYFIILCSDLHYIMEDDTKRLEKESSEVSKLLFGFTKSLLAGRSTLNASKMELK